MRTRRASAADADAVADVFNASFATLDFLPRVRGDDERRWYVRDVLLPDTEVWVAEEENGVVGFAALTDDMLAQLYVRPDAQRRGVGSALLDVVKERRPGGFTFWVFQQNDNARRFYEQHGCTVVKLTDGADNEERTPDALYAWQPRGPCLAGAP